MAATNSTKIELCRDRSWPNKHIEYLPHECRMKNGTHLVVDYATTDQLPAYYEIINNAAERGDNVGTDEFGSFDDIKDGLFSMAEIFQARDKRTNELQAFITIAPCLYARGYYTCIASIRVFRTTAVDDVDIIQLINLASKLTKDIDIGYTQCVTDVALCHSELIRLLREEDFHVAAMIPYCVNIVGIGLYWNAIMERKLGIPDKPMKSMKEIRERMELIFPSDQIAEDYKNFTPPQLDFLPKEYIFKNGLRIVIRCMRKEEDVIMYEIMRDAMEHGDGYAVNEYPTLSLFRGEILKNGTCIIYEEKATRKIIGYSIIFESWFKRSRGSKISESDVILTKEFRGRGIGKELIFIELGIHRKLGYRYLVSDTVIGNNQIIRLNRSLPGFTLNGVIQKAAYVEGKGWMDIVIGGMQYENDIKSASQPIEENEILHEKLFSKM